MLFPSSDEPGAAEVDGSRSASWRSTSTSPMSGRARSTSRSRFRASEIDRQYESRWRLSARGGRARLSARARSAATGRQAVQKQVSDQVKSTLLMSSLEQLDEDYKLDPITQPQLDVAGHRAARRWPDELRDGRRGSSAVRRARLHGAHGQAAGRRAHRRGRRDQLTAVPRSATVRSCPSSKGPPSWAIISRPTSRSSARTAACSTRSRRSSSASSRSFGSRTARSPTASALVGAKPGETREVEAKLGSAVGRARACAERPSPCDFRSTT